MEIQNLYIAAGIVLLINFLWLSFITIRQNKLIRRGKELFTSKKGDIYELTNNYLVKVKLIERENEKVKNNLEQLIGLFKNSFQKMGIVRYNPLKDVGGNLSFSIALLDFNDNGIMITNIHSREGDRIYAKSIKKGASEHNLSGEESEALKKATNKAEGRKE